MWFLILAMGEIQSPESVALTTLGYFRCPLLSLRPYGRSDRNEAQSRPKRAVANVRFPVRSRCRPTAYMGRLRPTHLIHMNGSYLTDIALNLPDRNRPISASAVTASPTLPSQHSLAR